VRLLAFVRFEHTIFALPLIYAGAVLAVRALPSPRLAGLLLIAAVGARTCAMALNRIVDRDLDAANPRTRDRELPAGRLSLAAAWAVAVAGAAALALAAAAISPLCLALAPIPVAVFAVYPFLKRWTALAHVGVGIADALGPAGAWVAVRSAAGQPVFADAGGLWYLLAFTVLWIAGFDVIYATQDEAHDRAAGLRSIPARVGRDRALAVSGLLHAAAAACLAFLWQSELNGPWALLALAGIVVLLIAEHERPDDLAFAFFQANAGVSVLVLALVGCGVLLPGDA
jgi:4-hydroxybenzoate polyprenyltransferase